MEVVTGYPVGGEVSVRIRPEDITTVMSRIKRH